MKTLFILCVLAFGYTFGQNYITQKDFIKLNDKLLKVDKIILTTNGENETVKTKLFIGKELPNKSTADFFNKMITIILDQAKYTLKNKSSFTPIDINIYQDGEKWFTKIGYSGSNSYGGRKDAELSLIFDANLTFEKKYQSPDLP